MGLLVATWGMQASAANTGASIAHWINEARRSEGLASLRPDHELGGAAGRHSRAMAQRGTIFYLQDIEALRRGCGRLTQFEARASSATEAYREAMASSEHRRQVYGDYDQLGIGYARDQAWTYVTWLFLRSADT